MTIRTLLGELAEKPVEAWLESGRELALEHDMGGASAVLQAAMDRHGDDSELRLALAGVRWQMRDLAGAQALLEALLAHQPDHAAAVFTLARLHIEQGGGQAAQAVLGDLFGRFRQPPDLVLRAARMLAESGRKQGAAQLCEAALAMGADAPSLRVYVAALQSQLGDFARSQCPLCVCARA